MDFKEKAKELLGKGARASKEAFNKAGNAIQDFSDKSVLKIDIKKLENEKEAVYSELGEYAASVFKENDSLSGNDEKVGGLLQKLSELEEKISGKKKELSEFDEKESEE